MRILYKDIYIYKGYPRKNLVLSEINGAYYDAKLTEEKRLRGIKNGTSEGGIYFSVSNGNDLAILGLEEDLKGYLEALLTNGFVSIEEETVHEVLYDL